MRRHPEKYMPLYKIIGQQSCRFLDPELPGRRVPYVEFDPNSQFELPCSSLLTIEDIIQGVIPEQADEPVPVKGCLEQRRLGLCPRDLGLNIPLELKP